MKKMNYDDRLKQKEEEEKIKRRNAALLLAYYFDHTEGWLAEARGGYLMIHWNPDNLAPHQIDKFLITQEIANDPCQMEELENVNKEIYDYFEGQHVDDYEDIKIEVAQITPEQVQESLRVIRAAIEEEEPEDVADWLSELCDDTTNDVSRFEGWGNVANVIKKAI